MEPESEHNGLIQAITLQMRNGVLVTGVYNSPATPPEQVVRTLDEAMSLEGEAHLLIGDSTQGVDGGTTKTTKSAMQ